MNVVAAQTVNNVIRGAEEVRDSLLLSHDADIADQIAAPLLQPIVARQDLYPFQLRSRADDDDATGRLAATLDSNATVGLICRDDHICQAESAALQIEEQAIEGLGLLRRVLADKPIARAT